MLSPLTHPTTVVAKGRKMRKSIATLEKDSLTPPATPAPGSVPQVDGQPEVDKPNAEHDGAAERSGDQHRHRWARPPMVATA